MQPLVQSTDEVPQGPLELHVYPGAECKGSIYLDDGHSFRYKEGAFLREDFTCEKTSGGIRVKLGAREGKFAPWWKQIEVVVHEWPGGGVHATFNGQSVQGRSSDSAAHVLVPETAAGGELVLTR
jgi:alpha-glucosidase